MTFNPHYPGQSDVIIPFKLHHVMYYTFNPHYPGQSDVIVWPAEDERVIAVFQSPLSGSIGCNGKIGLDKEKAQDTFNPHYPGQSDVI